MKTRKSAFSGKFYPSDKKDLTSLMERVLKSEKQFINTELNEQHIIGGVVPHAGYIYSAYQAVHFFEILKKCDQTFNTFIILNPNHTGYGQEISIDTNDYWETPLGKIEIDKELAEITKFEYSSEAHKYEHSGEVMLPFLQHFIQYEFQILPVTMSVQSFYNAQLIANRIFFGAKKLNRKICFVASSDFSHFVLPEYGKKQDSIVIEKILAFESENIINTVKRNNVSMCGYGPVASLTEFAQLVSDKPKAKLLKFGHSGEVHYSNDVVDYASILVYE